MICMFFTLFFTIAGGWILGFFFLSGVTIPIVFSFFYYHIPIAELATIETFIEIGLLIYLILIKVFRRNKFFKVLGIILIIFLAGIAIYISFRYKIIWAKDIPVLGDLYTGIYGLFSGILDKLLKFFTGK